MELRSTTRQKLEMRRANHSSMWMQCYNAMFMLWDYRYTKSSTESSRMNLVAKTLMSFPLHYRKSKFLISKNM
jgi:hypothetical protein